jgi:hypothetical protein
MLDDWAGWPDNSKMTGNKPASDMRKERLAKALKANLSRRKMQARNRQAVEDPEPMAEAPETEDGCPN